MALRQIWSKLNCAALGGDRGSPRRSPREAATYHTPTGNPCSFPKDSGQEGGVQPSLRLIPFSLHPDQVAPPFLGPGPLLALPRSDPSWIHSPQPGYPCPHPSSPKDGLCLRWPLLDSEDHLNYLEFICPASIISPRYVPGIGCWGWVPP